MSTGLKANVDGSAAIQVGGVDAITLTSAGAASFVTSPMTIQGGSASAPSLTFSGDTNTGIFSPAADTIAFAEGGVESMRIDSSGNVGIGTSTPTQKLDVKDGRIALTEVYDVRWISSGGTLRGSISADSGSNLYFGTGSSNTERARIDSSGNLLVGKTAVNNSSTGVYIAGGGNADHGMINVARPPNTTMIQIVNSSGNTVVGQISQNGTNTTYSTSSDYRLKDNVQPMTGALAKVALLKPCNYTWKADGSDGEGFIAHELAEVVPDAVTGEKDAVDAEGKPVYQGIDTSFLVATLTAAIKEQQQMIETLQAKVAALEAK